MLTKRERVIRTVNFQETDYTPIYDIFQNDGLIEHYAGAFPVWLAPIQARLIPIADRHLAYAHEVAKKLETEGIRVEVDERAERMNSKIRDAQNQKIPYMLVVGDKEAEAGAVALRLRGGENPGAIPLADFIARAKKETLEGI